MDKFIGFDIDNKHMLATSVESPRVRILGAFSAQLDRITPEDEGVPLKGATEHRYMPLPGTVLVMGDGKPTDSSSPAPSRR